MAGLSNTELDNFLSKGTILAKIATSKPDGSPYVNPVWYDWDGKEIFIISKPKAQFVQNIYQNDSVAVLIDSPTPPHIRVLIEGNAKVRDGNHDWIEMGKRLARKYHGEHGVEYIDKTKDWRRVIITVSPRKITSWDGSLDWPKRYIELIQY